MTTLALHVAGNFPAHKFSGKRAKIGSCAVGARFGSKSDAIGPAVVEAQAAALPDATTHVVPGLGHFGPLQDPDAVASLVVKALAAS